MISMFAAPRQNSSILLRCWNTSSSECENDPTTRVASSRQLRPKMCDAMRIHAAVAFVYVLVALPYSGPARIGSLLRTSDQQALWSLLQSNARGVWAPLSHNRTSSALSPEVVTSKDSAALSQ